MKLNKIGLQFIFDGINQLIFGYNFLKKVPSDLNLTNKGYTTITKMDVSNKILVWNKRATVQNGF